MGALRKSSNSLSNSMLLRGASVFVGSKCTTGHLKKLEDDDGDDGDDFDDDDDTSTAGKYFGSWIVSVGCNGYPA
jgi:hypothetical protein